MDTHLTVSQAARLLKMSPDGIIAAINRKGLAASKFGRDWALMRSEVERYGREQRGKPGRRRIHIPDAN